MPGVYDANGNTYISIGDTTGTGRYSADGALRVAISPEGLFATLDNNTFVPNLSESATAAANGAKLEAAVTAAAASNGSVKLPTGRFPMQASITGAVTLEFNPDTVLIQSQNAYVLNIDLSADASGPHTVSAFSYATHASAAGASTNKFMRLTVGAAASANFQKGDAVVISSQDTRTYYAAGNTNYMGEAKQVIDVDTTNGYIYLDGDLFLTGRFTTSPVVYRLSRKKVRLIRPQVEANGDVYTTGLGGSWPGAIQLIAAHKPEIKDIRVNSAWGIGLYCKSVVAGNITVDRIVDLPGDPANNRYGYGILLRGSCYANKITGGYIGRCRHGFTTDARQTGSYAASNVFDHGDCTANVVDGVTSVSNGAPPFDTHENSIATTFINCTAIGARYSPLGITAATGIGFNLRGPWDRVVNCQAIDCEGGVNVAATGLIHELAGENVINGFQFIGEALNNLSGYAILLDANASETTPQNVSITNVVPGRGSRFLLVPANYTGKITLANNVLRGYVDMQIRVQGSCTMDFANVVFDMQEAGTGENCIVVDNSNTVTASMVNCWVRSKNATTPTAVWNVSTGATLTLRHANCGELTANGTVMSTGAGTITKTAITVFT
jgi:hypothetical protein